MFSELKTKISDDLNDIKSFNKLKELIEDPDICDDFFDSEGPKWVISIYTKTPEKNRSIILDIIEKISKNHIIQSDNIIDEFIDELFKYCHIQKPDILMLCKIYRLLAYCIKNYEDLYEITMDSIQLNTLIQTLMCDNEEIHAAVLSLINAVYESTPPDFQSNLAQVMLEKNELRVIIYKYVLKSNIELCGNLRKEMTTLQNVLLHRELEGYKNPINMDQSKIDEFKKIISGYDPSENVNVVMKKLGFRTSVGLEEELTSPCNMLLVDCITFYVTKNATAAYYPEIGPSLFRLIKVATTEVVKNIKCFSNPMSKINYLPCFFERPNGFFELVCKIIKNHKTSLKEYESCEESEILNHLQEKVKRTLLRRPFDFNHFHIELERLTKIKLDILMTDEANKWTEKLKGLEPVNRLRQFYSPQVEELIKKQIYNRMSEGLNVEIINVQKLKKASKDDYVLFKLNSAFNAFEYTTEGAQITTIPLSDITKVSYGESCIGKIDEKLAKKVPVSSLVVFDMKNNEKHAISIEPEDHRIISDVINLAENKKIDDTWEPESYSTLLQTIIDVALMDLTEQDIPSEAPPVPPEPSDYNFSWIE